jgi:hypothetical protein
LRSDENMLESGSIQVSHVFLESQASSHFSKALTAEVEPVLPDDGAILTAPLARPCTLAVLSLFSSL